MTADVCLTPDGGIRQEAEDEVRCQGCCEPGGIEIVIGDTELSAWHRVCLAEEFVQLDAPFTGTWRELEALLPYPEPMAGSGDVP